MLTVFFSDKIAVTYEDNSYFERKEEGMFQIAICDEDRAFCEYFKECLEIVVKKLKIKCSISVWNKGNELKKHLIGKNRVDLLFLEIELGESNGVSLGKFIREELMDFQTKLVYISHDQGYAMKLFETEPMDFLVKPVDKEQIEKIMQRFIKRQVGMGNVFTFKEERGETRISFDSIWYFQSMNHKIIMHTTDGQKEFYGKLTEIENKTPDYFWRIHKSFLVNEHFIIRFLYDKVILKNEQKLTISKPYRKMIRERIEMRMNER